MKPIYNSSTGRVRRPRKKTRPVGVMPKHLAQELAGMDKVQGLALKMGAMMTLVSLGVDVINLGR